MEGLFSPEGFATGAGPLYLQLQRRIAEHGTSYRRLVDEARQELGRHLLADGGNSVDEIAFLLGFQDKGSFYRAFRGWEGVTPASWRSMN